MIDEKARVFSDRDWWQSAGDAFDLDLRGWTDRNEASFADNKTGRRLEMPGWLAERIIAYESAKPKEAKGQPVQEMHTLDLKLGSRLTVEGVEAVVVPVEPDKWMLNAMAFYHIQHAGAAGEVEISLARSSYRAMLSAAGDEP